MDNNIFEGMWKQVRGQVKQRWGELTDDELDQISGQQDQLVGRLQEKYGYSKERADQEVADFLQTLTKSSSR